MPGTAPDFRLSQLAPICAAWSRLTGRLPPCTEVRFEDAIEWIRDSRMPEITKAPAASWLVARGFHLVANPLDFVRRVEAACAAWPGMAERVAISHDLSAPVEPTELVIYVFDPAEPLHIKLSTDEQIILVDSNLLAVADGSIMVDGPADGLGFVQHCHHRPAQHGAHISSTRDGIHWTGINPLKDQSA